MSIDIPVDVDPFIAERVTQIRDRFGLSGLRVAIQLARAEIALFEDVESEHID